MTDMSPPQDTPSNPQSLEYSVACPRCKAAIGQECVDDFGKKRMLTICCERGYVLWIVARGGIVN